MSLGPKCDRSVIEEIAQKSLRTREELLALHAQVMSGDLVYLNDQSEHLFRIALQLLDHDSLQAVLDNDLQILGGNIGSLGVTKLIFIRPAELTTLRQIDQALTGGG